MVKIFQLYKKENYKLVAVNAIILILLTWFLFKDQECTSDKVYSSDGQYATYYERECPSIINTLIPTVAMPGTGGTNFQQLRYNFYVYDEVEKKILFEDFVLVDYITDSAAIIQGFAKDSFNLANVKIKLPRPVK